jgi:hypothetical protein
MSGRLSEPDTNDRGATESSYVQLAVHNSSPIFEIMYKVDTMNTCILCYYALHTFCVHGSMRTTKADIKILRFSILTLVAQPLSKQKIK